MRSSVFQPHPTQQNLVNLWRRYFVGLRTLVKGSPIAYPKQSPVTLSLPWTGGLVSSHPNQGLQPVYSLYRITELLSRIKYGNRGIFYDTTFSVVDQFFPPLKKRLIFSGQS